MNRNVILALVATLFYAVPAGAQPAASQQAASQPTAAPSDVGAPSDARGVPPAPNTNADPAVSVSPSEPSAQSVPSSPVAWPPGQPFPPPGATPLPVVAPTPTPLVVAPVLREGLTADGFPITRRGHVAIEISSMEIHRELGYYGDQMIESEGFAAMITLDARAHVAGRYFATARFGTGFGGDPYTVAKSLGPLPGNLMGGVEALFRPTEWLWIAAGISLGAPIVQDSSALPSYSFADGLWSVHEHAWNTVPARFAVGGEMVLGKLSARVDLEPIVLFVFDRQQQHQVAGWSGGGSNDPQLSFRHAAEIQYGHSLGVGLRYQGVALSDNAFRRMGGLDRYQGCVEPFVVVRREAGFARLGFLKTLDEDTLTGAIHSTPYRDSWGVRLSAGFHLD